MRNLLVTFPDGSQETVPCDLYRDGKYTLTCVRLRTADDPAWEKTFVLGNVRSFEWASAP